MYICDCYVLIFHSVVPNVSATAWNGAAAQEGWLVLQLTQSNVFSGMGGGGEVTW